MGTMLMVADEHSLIEAAVRTKLDLVIADLSFPISSGENVARLLQRLNPDLKAIILSVHGEQTVMDACIAAGAKGFVLKRSAFTDLLAAVETVLMGGDPIMAGGGDPRWIDFSPCHRMAQSQAI
jgi:DNA-binding NarL/FixJ family response regulator